MSLLAYFPEPGTPDRKQIAALAGVAPINRYRGIMIGNVYIPQRSGNWNPAQPFQAPTSQHANWYNPVQKRP